MGEIIESLCETVEKDTRTNDLARAHARLGRREAAARQAVELFDQLAADLPVVRPNGPEVAETFQPIFISTFIDDDVTKVMSVELYRLFDGVRRETDQPKAKYIGYRVILDTSTSETSPTGYNNPVDTALIEAEPTGRDAVEEVERFAQFMAELVELVEPPKLAVAA